MGGWSRKRREDMEMEGGGRLEKKEVDKVAQDKALQMPIGGNKSKSSFILLTSTS